MDRTGPILSMLTTTALVVGGAVFGYHNPRQADPWVAAALWAGAGLIVAAYVRIIVLRVMLPVWRRVTFTTQAGWMVLQVGFTLLGLWAGLSVDLPSEKERAFQVVVSTAFGFGMGIAITALWAWSYDLLRYRLPRLVRGGLQKVRGRQHVGLR